MGLGNIGKTLGLGIGSTLGSTLGLARGNTAPALREAAGAVGDGHMCIGDMSTQLEAPACQAGG